MFLTKLSDGNYYLCRRSMSSNPKGRMIKNDYQRIFIVKAYNSHSSVYGYVTQNITCPAELIGKKIMLRVEVVDEDFVL